MQLNRIEKSKNHTALHNVVNTKPEKEKFSFCNIFSNLTILDQSKFLPEFLIVVFSGPEFINS